jgi:hypothetical protein
MAQRRSPAMSAFAPLSGAWRTSPDLMSARPDSVSFTPKDRRRCPTRGPYARLQRKPLRPGLYCTPRSFGASATDTSVIKLIPAVSAAIGQTLPLYWASRAVATSGSGPRTTAPVTSRAKAIAL